MTGPMMAMNASGPITASPSGSRRKDPEPVAVRFSHVSHRFRSRDVVRDLSLDIRRSEVFGLLGPNGAGKSTTIRLLTTLLPVQQGSIAVFGFDVSREPMPARHCIGYVPQRLSVDGDLTAYQNVSWFARLYDVPRRHVRRRVHDALGEVGLLDVADRVSSGFSGGMMRRLELAQALVATPRLLVLDEPTVGLDPLARDEVWTQIGRLRESSGMTVLLTTHYMEEADALCDRVALMADGSLRAEGSPAELESALGGQATLEDVFRKYSIGPQPTGNPDGGSATTHGPSANRPPANRPSRKGR